MLHRGIRYGMEDFPLTGRRSPANPSAESWRMHEKFNPWARRGFTRLPFIADLYGAAHNSGNLH
jgi:hypothetical protein